MTTLTHQNLPRHVAIIMDGNGRWARSRGLPRIAGHHRGADVVRRIVTDCRKRGIKVLSLFAFSSQNWSRPNLEVSALMKLLLTYLKSERSTILDNGIRLSAIGELGNLPPDVRDSLLELSDVSAHNNDMVLNLCLSFGGREEIANMARTVATKVAAGELSPNDINVDLIDSYFWSSALGPVDLMIRTSGELRISNFLLWGLAYSELFFTEKMWPDFDEVALSDALDSYSQRHRRFGAVS